VAAIQSGLLHKAWLLPGEIRQISYLDKLIHLNVMELVHWCLDNKGSTVTSIDARALNQQLKSSTIQPYSTLNDW